jgi:hypothetical protein
MSHISRERPQEYRRTGQLTDCERHELLANERRQRVFSVLDDQQAPVTLETIAREVTECEAALANPGTDGPRGVRTSPEDVQRVRVSLHHVHLPKMTAFGVLEYDPTTRRVES